MLEHLQVVTLTIEHKKNGPEHIKRKKVKSLAYMFLVLTCRAGMKCITNSVLDE
jgi:hypothetical protein